MFAVAFELSCIACFGRVSISGVFDGSLRWTVRMWSGEDHDGIDTS